MKSTSEERAAERKAAKEQTHTSEKVMRMHFGRSNRVIGSYGDDVDKTVIASAQMEAINQARAEGRDVSAISFTLENEEIS